MKEICGYKSNDGQFYENKQDCLIADIQYDIRKIKNDLDGFPGRISTIVMNRSSETRIEWTYHQRELLDIIVKEILYNFDSFAELVEESRKKEKLLDYLRQEEKDKNGQIYTWWLKFKWWK